jgi:hypothetical protein
MRNAIAAGALLRPRRTRLLLNYYRLPDGSPAPPEPEVLRDFIAPPEELPAVPCPEVFVRTRAPALPDERSPEVVVVVDRVVLEPLTFTLAPVRSRTPVRLDTPTPMATPGRRCRTTAVSPLSTTR